MSAQGAWFKDGRQLQGLLVTRIAYTYTGRTDGGVLDPLDSDIVVRLQIGYAANAPVFAGQTSTSRETSFTIQRGTRAGTTVPLQPGQPGSIPPIPLAIPPGIQDGFQLQVTARLLGGTATYKGMTLNIPAGPATTDAATFRMAAAPPGAGITVDIEIT